MKMTERQVNAGLNLSFMFIGIGSLVVFGEPIGRWLYDKPKKEPTVSEKRWRLVSNIGGSIAIVMGSVLLYKTITSERSD
jgi:hypothetical protein